MNAQEKASLKLEIFAELRAEVQKRKVDLTKDTKIAEDTTGVEEARLYASAAIAMTVLEAILVDLLWKTHNQMQETQNAS